MSNFTPAQLAELKQMLTPGMGSVTRTPGGTSGNFTPAQLQEIRKIVLSVTSEASKGRFAGFGNPQVDSKIYVDNCTAAFPFTFDFVIPKNFQRWTSVHASFKLRAFRRYVSAINNSSVTSSGTAHYHWFGGYSGAGAAAHPASWDANQNMTTTDGIINTSNTSNEIVGTSPGSGTAAGVGTPAGHTHTLTPTTSLSTGIFEDTTPTSVSLKVDGTDYTATLGGPWTSDTVELDITKVMPNATGVFHTIQLTPNQNGRITVDLRFSYYMDGSVIA